MVIEEGFSTVAIGNNNSKQDLKSTWDAMNSSTSSSGMKRSKQSSSNSSSSSSKKLQQEAPTADPWGPVFKNRQHFVDMHLC